MEIIVTKYVVDHENAKYYSASQAELGEDAGKITWENALDRVEEEPLVTTEEEIQECKDYLKSFGAWDAEEIAAWSDQEVNALMLQEISGCIREMKAFKSYKQYEKAAERGTVSGRLFKSGREWFYYVGN